MIAARLHNTHSPPPHDVTRLMLTLPEGGRHGEMESLTWVREGKREGRELADNRYKKESVCVSKSFFLICKRSLVFNLPAWREDERQGNGRDRECNGKGIFSVRGKEWKERERGAGD